MLETLTENYEIERLDKAHQRHCFECGIVSLDNYLKKQAGQALRNCTAITYVLTEENSKDAIGFYTLSAMTIELKHLPASLSSKLPKHPLIPATLIGRLAIDRRYQKNGLGEILLVNALKKAYETSKTVASFAIIVEAINKTAEQFYKRYGFQNLPTRKKLYLPMKTVSKL